MLKKSMCLKVPKGYGEKAIVLSNKLKIINRELEIRRDKDFIYVPLIRQPSKSMLEEFKERLLDCGVVTFAFPERKKQSTTFVELLENKLPSHLLVSLPRAIDFVGDIAIIEISPELDAYKNVIGAAILKTCKNVQTIIAKAGAVTGPYRLRKFRIIAGEPRTETVHREYGCKYYVDLAKAYFSPRLSYEHNRVASLVKEGETITDLFAGVGPFSILIAKTHEKVKVYTIDANPNAIEFLKKNIRVNRVENKICPILGDARRIVRQRLLGIADRVIMNLPGKSLEFVDAACEGIKPTGGIVHFYSFVNASNSPENVKQQFGNAVKKCGRKVEKILCSRFVRATAPYEWQIVFDAKIR